MKTTWPDYFLAQMGGGIPTDYFCFDTETTGFSREHDVIVEWGHVVVRDCKPVDKVNLVINWIGSGLVDDDYVISALARVRRRMAVEGKHYRITPEVMREEGISPEEALPFIYNMCCKVQENNEIFAAHNGLNYDASMLLAHFKDFGVGEYSWRPNDIFDTGGAVKALRLGRDPKSSPRKGETLRDYFKRLVAMRVAGLRWGLDGPYVAGMNLQRFDIDLEDAHVAGNDALVVHGIVEHLREWQAEEAVARPSPAAARRSKSLESRTPADKSEQVERKPVAGRKRRQRNR